LESKKHRLAGNAERSSSWPPNQPRIRIVCGGGAEPFGSPTYIRDWEEDLKGLDFATRRIDESNGRPLAKEPSEASYDVH